MASTTEFPIMNDRECERRCELLNALLRGELAAVETYGQALEKFEDEETLRLLEAIRDEHLSAVRLLGEHVRDFGGEPDATSGLWGSFARTVTGAAKVLGPQSVLAALHEGEEQGILACERTINNTDLPQECMTMIHRELIPRGHKHVATLEQLIQRYGR